MAKSADERLSAIRLKIERANRHIRDLEASRTAFRNANANCLVEDQESQPGQIILRFKLRSKLTDDVSCIIGDAIHNIRAALDHLVSHLVDANNGKPTRDNQFPICKTAASFKRRTKKEPNPSAEVKGVPDGAIDLIQATKAYKRRDRRDSVLWILHDLDIIDKHRQLLIGVAAPKTIELRDTPTTDRILSKMFNIQWPDPATTYDQLLIWTHGDRFRVLKDGCEVCTVPATVGKSEMNNNVNLVLEIAFAKPKIIKGYPVIPFLHQLAQLVDGIISRFRPFL